MANKDSTAAPTLTLSSEEREIVRAYRHLARWDKNAVFLILQSLAVGKLGDSTNKLSWGRMAQVLGLRKAVHHA